MVAIEMSKQQIQEQEFNKYAEWETWKQNTSFLYNFVGCTRLKSGSITLDWSTDLIKDPNEPTLDRQLVLIGTCMRSNARSKNRLKVVSVPVPVSSSQTDVVDCEINKYMNRPEKVSDYEGFGIANLPDYQNYGAVNEAIYAHPGGEVNRARFNTSDPSICATSGPDGKIQLFKLYDTLEDILNRQVNHPKPIRTLHEHSDENWSIQWNRFASHRLLSCGADSKVVVWDTELASVESRKITHFEGYHLPPTDAVWRSKDVFLSSDEGGHLRIFDMRDHNQIVADHSISSSLNAVRYCIMYHNLVRSTSTLALSISVVLRATTP
eukprot:GHVH01011653.1.p1 GENE.GHVH01011653.1~~GHVH01011653.1.p1  ORF type:complete len:323 (+),score=35.21 GHVH01011653.1:14-982(+)